jgi:dipeptidyl aminopeptidase/acylaminoacyl peptidase
MKKSGQATAFRLWNLWAPIAAFLLASGVVSAQTTRADPTVGPSVKEVIEFTRIVQPVNNDNDALQLQISPDRKKAFVVTRRSDVRSDKNHFEILLLDLEPARLAALRSRQPARLLAVNAKEDRSANDPPIQEARWIGDSTIVLRARINDAAFQVYSLDTATRRLTQLTFSSHPIVSFDVSLDLKRVVYAMRLPNPIMPPGARSVVVQNHSFWNVMYGQNDVIAQKGRYQYFVNESGARAAAKALGPSFTQIDPPTVAVSPNGRWALLKLNERDRQPQWAKQYPLIAGSLAELAPLDLDPLAYFSQPDAYLTRRLFAYRLADAGQSKGRLVLDAPDDAAAGAFQSRQDLLWQRQGDSVVIAGTHLPVTPGAETPDNTASHIIEYWPESGKWAVIARLKGRLDAVYPVADDPNGFVASDGGKRRRFQRLPSKTWAELDEPKQTAASPAQWTLRVAESWNEPPDVAAVGPGGELVKLTQLNPQFDSATWGTVRAYSWKDREGRQWNGGLIVPNHFDANATYPLVIQTYGFVRDRFYLDGSNWTPTFTSGFPGRAFARQNVLVLAMPYWPEGGTGDDDRKLNAAFMDGADGAINALVGQGLVDRDRIGIMGFSATGNQVNRYLTFGDSPIRAATLLDADSGTLFTTAITYGFHTALTLSIENENDGKPFGQSVDRWVKNDPSLSTHCVNAALRIESYGPWVLGHWDTYALLRRQYKPVEMIMIPQGTHSLSRPSERMISLQGNVDWYRFWLKGEERTEPLVPGETEASLKEQYVRWRQMAELKKADDAKPRCAPNRGVR